MEEPGGGKRRVSGCFFREISNSRMARSSSVSVSVVDRSIWMLCSRLFALILISVVLKSRLRCCSRQAFCLGVNL